MLWNTTQQKKKKKKKKNQQLIHATTWVDVKKIAE